jgi:hypothetical protein
MCAMSQYPVPTFELISQLTGKRKKDAFAPFAGLRESRHQPCFKTNTNRRGKQPRAHQTANTLSSMAAKRVHVPL